ncbi:hypothetical protein [Thaumasiovibrio subtropicus]|uniref:hypothetical protein n=1 Tax=Thaumasiovibrio subtropicus TaxID=1891207 RepID=UPI000B34D779|nr:hypothetical protein [Thaumasiovibrio subtropicus]
MIFGNKLLAAMVAAVMLGGCSSNESEQIVEMMPIDHVVVQTQHYPENFVSQLETNLQYFRDGIGVDAIAGIPYDFIRLHSDGEIDHQRVANSTTIGLYLNVLTEMERSGSPEARDRLLHVLTQLEQAPTWHGLFFWMYQITEQGELKVGRRGVASAVDAANLTSALAAVAGAYWQDEDPELAKIGQRAHQLVQATTAGWQGLYDEGNNPSTLLRAAWIEDEKQGSDFAPYFVDRKSNESRLAPLWATVLTMNEGTPIPATVFTDMTTYTGHYTSPTGEEFAPLLTWNGTFFQAMLPTIWFDELNLVPDRKMFDDMARVQLDYVTELGIPFLSSSSTIDSRYDEYGVDGMAENYYRNARSAQAPVGTPHATALYAMLNRDHAVELLLDIESRHPAIVSQAGWFDAVNSEGEITNKIIGLDQGMFAASFFAETVRADVERYIREVLGQEAWRYVESLYQDFVADEHLVAGEAERTIPADTE